LNRINNCLDALSKKNKKALIPFVTAGDPDADFTLSCMHKMVDAGSDIIELGVPFSDPMADGPTIQKASERALAAGMSLNGVLDIVRRFRETNTVTPVVLMGYLNPIEFMGYEVFASNASEAGVDGVLTVDIPPEEADDFARALKERDIAPIFLLSPTSDVIRIKRIAEVASGYIYYVSLKGVTGAGHLDLEDVKTKLAHIKTLTSLPLAVGFGVKNAEIAAEMAKIGDAVVVGSALIERIVTHQGNEEKAEQAIFELLSSMRTSMDATA
jgi:tryptophan synthase alpha chain